MKKIILLLLGILIIGFAFIFYIKYKNAKDYENSIKTFPEVDLINYAISKETFYDKGSINCYLIFNSECDICLNEIEDIVDDIDFFEHVNFYLISNQPKKELMLYSEDSEFLDLRNFSVLKDNNDLFFNFFNYSVTPSTYIYSKNDTLIDFRQGYIPIYELKMLLNEN